MLENTNTDTVKCSKKSCKNAVPKDGPFVRCSKCREQNKQSQRRVRAQLKETEEDEDIECGPQKRGDGPDGFWEDEDSENEAGKVRRNATCSMSRKITRRVLAL